MAVYPERLVLPPVRDHQDRNDPVDSYGEDCPISVPRMIDHELS